MITTSLAFAIAIILTGFYTSRRISIFRAVGTIEAKGASVLWDIDIHPTEGGTLKLNEGRMRRRVRRILFSVPRTVTFSDLLKGSDNFRSSDVREVQGLGPLERLAILDLPVRVADLQWLLSHSRIEKLALFDVDIETECIAQIQSISDCKVEIHSQPSFRIADGSSVADEAGNTRL